MINTLEIAERLSRAFGKEAAQELSTVLANYHEDLRQSLLKEEFAELRGEVQGLTEAQRRTEENLASLAGRVEELAEAQRRTERRVEELAEAQKRTERRVEELAEAQKRTEKRLEDLIGVIQMLVETAKSHEIRLGKLDGRTLESQFREKASAYLGRVMRGTRVIPAGDLADELVGLLTDEEWEDLLRADVIVKGRAMVSGVRQETFAVVEVSVTLDQSDIERAARRAALLRKKGWRALAVASGEEISAPLIENAARLGVAVMQDGRQFNWPEALAAA